MENEKLDLIDRHALLENADVFTMHTKEYGSIEVIPVDAVGDAPTVDARPVVHGQWLDGYAVDSSGKKVYDSIDCSVCNEIFKIESHDREYWKNRFKECPFCGSQMDGGNGDV